MNPSPPPSLRPVAQLAWSLLAVASFHAAHVSGFGWLLLPCACALIQLSHASTPRLVFYPLLGETNFHNMAYVIGTDGTIVHQQAKSVPIQFFADGLPAAERKVWDSPWGKIGVLTCYDLSYTRVVDHFVRQGAIALTPAASTPASRGTWPNINPA